MNNIIYFKSDKISCSDCSLAHVCLPEGLDNEELDLHDKHTQRAMTIGKGDYLFRSGQAFKSIFVVRTGSIKTTIVTNDGEEQIIGFHMPGDMLGFDAFSQNIHSCTAVALENSSVCELPYQHMRELCQDSHALSKHFMALMSNEIADKHKTMLMLSKKTAESKLVALLLNLSSRYHERGLPAQQFNLSMTRNDIASFLGLAVETVSRLLGHIHDEGIIEIERKSINIRDMENLQKLANN
jgi:CRP/FNR family transcriptional regulator